MKGFTLVEILVVIAIVAILGLVLMAIFVNTLRGGNKSQILANIKQNGQAVLENMDKTIRGSDNIVCINTDPEKTVLVVVKNGSYIRYQFIPENISENTNGSIKQDSPDQLHPTPEPNVNVFLAGVCTPPLDPSAVVLTDTNLQTGVSVKQISGKPFFALDNLAGYKNSVTVQFSLGPGIGAPAAVAGQVDPVEFTTTIGLR